MSLHFCFLSSSFGHTGVTFNTRVKEKNTLTIEDSTVLAGMNFNTRDDVCQHFCFLSSSFGHAGMIFNTRVKEKNTLTIEDSAALVGMIFNTRKTMG